jgi:hypothetical protein
MVDWVDRNDHHSRTRWAAECHLGSLIIDERRTALYLPIDEPSNRLERPADVAIVILATYEDNLIRRKALARARRAQQDLVAHAAAQAIDELLDRLWLVAGRLEGSL